MKKLSVVGVALAASVLCATPISLRWSPDTTSVLAVDRADARIGRPLTPMSVAGVTEECIDAPTGAPTTTVVTLTNCTELNRGSLSMRLNRRQSSRCIRCN
jgi:hypothetical protein